MKDNFDNWNKQKKVIDSESSARFYREREVWWCKLGKNIGSEQDGKGEFYERPILIVRAFNRYVCIAIPLTTSTKKNLYHFEIGYIEKRRAAAIISQIRLIDTKRLTNRISILDPETFFKIRKTIRDLF